MASRVYKAKRKKWRELPKEKHWVEGAIFEGEQNSYIITNVKETDEWEDSEIGADVIGYLVDPETICQDAGLTDKNGRKIFGGDIVSIPGKKNHNVKFEYGQFCIGLNWPIVYSRRECEVIGNIFDNPELME